MGLVLGVASAIGVIGAAAAPETTPVSGPSWIEHLGAQLDDTPMGKMGGAGPPSRSPREEPMPGEGGGAPFVLTGADLYRLSCRSCHGPAGQGAPPAILPLLDPVRATSPAVLELRAEALIGEEKLVQLDALPLHKKYGDLFSMDDVPEEELEAVARQVADRIIARLKESEMDVARFHDPVHA